MIVVYKLISPSGKVYIGQTRNCEKRKKNYKLLQCKQQKILYNSLSKHGFDNHNFEILYTFPTDVDQNTLDIYETFCYDQFLESGCQMLNGIRPDGQSGHAPKGWKHSEEAKKKLSDAKLGDKNPRFGKTYTTEEKEFIYAKQAEAFKNPETRVKMSRPGEKNWFFGKKHSPELQQRLNDAKKKPVVYLPTGEWFKSLGDAIRELQLEISYFTEARRIQKRTSKIFNKSNS